ncbi:MAG: PIN domain-containing protein [Burkholderiales bacterium]
MILVDSCVLIDVIEGDVNWADWSAGQLHRYRRATGLAINLIIYAEIAKSFDSLQRLDEFIADLRLEVADIPRAAAWHAASVHLAYRRNRGTMSVTLADFFIGAHAHAETCPILTRDTKRFATYFPRVKLITP